MSKQFTLDQFPGYGRHIYRHEVLFLPVTVIMNRFSHHFLTGSGFPVDKNINIGLNRFGNQVKYFLQAFTLPDHRFLKRKFLAQFFP